MRNDADDPGSGYPAGRDGYLMGDIRDPETDQPAPIPNSMTPIQKLVIMDMEDRMLHGIRKYGVALQPFNGRNALKDAYEEVLDLAVYLKQRLVEEAFEVGDGK